MSTVRPIQSDEFSTFIATATEPRRRDDVRHYVEDLLEKGVMRSDWCYLAEHDGDPIGRGAFWTLPEFDHPLSIVLLDLPWQRELGSAAGAALLEEMVRVARSLDGDELEYVLDRPAQRPQWQTHPESRASLLKRHGFELTRETFRFDITAEESTSRPAVDHEVVFRSLEEVGDDVVRDAIRRISAETLDRQTRTERAKLGPQREATEFLAELSSTEYDPRWWEVAYTQTGTLIGLIAPTVIPAGGSIGYLGVVPEMRGQGYVDVLLSRGTATLLESGVERIVADTDRHNTPMADALRRAGYTRFATRREYAVSFTD